MEVAQLQRLTVGSGAGPGHRRPRSEPARAPGLFWLCGYKSDMSGTKASALDGFAARTGLALTRFDYSGHGQSGGDFLGRDDLATGWRKPWPSSTASRAAR